MEQTCFFKLQDQLSYFEIICLMALVFKEQARRGLVVAASVGHQCSDGETRSLAGLGSPGNTEGRLQKSPSRRQESFKKGKKAGGSFDDVVAVCQEKGAIGWDPTPSRKILGLEQDRF